jgi:hypothetical protein
MILLLNSSNKRFTIQTMNTKAKNIVSTLVVFLVFMAIGWMLALHFRHVLLETFIFSKNDNTAATYFESSGIVASADYQIEEPYTQDNSGCGCPTCCALNL